MTRKDYAAIEESLYTRLDVLENDIATCETKTEEKYLTARIEGYLDACETLADVLASNPRFDRDHFLAVVRGEKELDSKPERKKHPASYAKRTGTIDVCDCADRSWYGKEHDSACPYAGQPREGIA